jgi:hypothetical protein
MRDRKSYLPITALMRLVECGLLGNMTKTFHSGPTMYSHRLTTETNAPEILRRVVAGDADALLLVPI